MLREHRLLVALADTDVPHPRVIAGCDDPTVVGGCFYLMDFVDGWSPIQEGTPGPSPSAPTSTPGGGWPSNSSTGSPVSPGWTGRPGVSRIRQARRLPRAPGRPLAPPPGGRPVPTAPRHRRGGGVAAHPPAALLPSRDHARRLPVRQRHVPPRRAGAPGRHRRLGDGHRRDPLLDLGWVINGWPDDTSAGAQGTISYVDFTGMPSRDELLDAYATASGRPVDEIDYYVILARFKLAIVLEAGYARVVAGEADNPKMAKFGDVVLDMAARPRSWPPPLRCDDRAGGDGPRRAVRPHRPGGPGHRRQPGPGSGHGAGIRRRRRPRRRGQPQARRLPGRGDEVRSRGRDALAVAVNVSHWDELDGLVDQAYDRFGGSTCWSTTPGCRSSTATWPTWARPCGTRWSAST